MDLESVVKNTNEDEWQRLWATYQLGWVSRSKIPINFSCLKLKDVYLLHMPGELFVEYQLFAKKYRKDAFVCMAAYGDYAPSYIGTKVACDEGGYESDVSYVPPESEQILKKVIGRLLTK